MSSSSDHCSKISVAIIVRNAAEALAETLSSVRNIADEIVVLDTGSTDQTIQVAQNQATSVHEHAFNDSFSEARNECLKHVSGDWVLWLDAGERITADTAQQLRQFIDTEADRSKAYMMLVQVPPEDQNISGEQIGSVRLVPNHPGIAYEGRVRERMTKSLKKNGIEVIGIPHRILRGAKDNIQQTKILRARRNIQLVDLEIKERGPLPHLLNCMGEAHQLLQNNSEAIRFYKQALESAESGSDEMLEAFYGLLTSMDSQQDRQTQLSICLKALETFPLDAQLLCAMGGYLQTQDRLDLAARSYQTAYQHGKIAPSIWHLDQIQEVAAVCFALALQLQKKDDSAQQVLEDAVVVHPQCFRLRRHLIELHVKHGRQKDALKQLNDHPDDVPNIEALRSAIRGACLVKQENWISARTYLDAAYKAGCRDVICLRGLSLTLAAMGNIQKTMEMLREWISIDPNSVEATALLAAISGPEQQPTAEKKQANESRLVRVDSPATAEGAGSPTIAPATTRPTSESANRPTAT